MRLAMNNAGLWVVLAERTYETAKIRNTGIINFIFKQIYSIDVKKCSTRIPTGFILNFPHRYRAEILVPVPCYSVPAMVVAIISVIPGKKIAVQPVFFSFLMKIKMWADTGVGIYFPATIS
jgi:hypothetical protein